MYRKALKNDTQIIEGYFLKDQGSENICFI